MAVNSGRNKRKERNSFRRARRPIIFLVAEGKNKTETLYFRDFGQDVNRIIKFAPGNHTDPVNMVNELKSYIAENDFSQDLGDKAYCLIDETHQGNQFSLHLPTNNLPDLYRQIFCFNSVR